MVSIPIEDIEQVIECLDTFILWMDDHGNDDYQYETAKLLVRLEKRLKEAE